MFTAQQIDVVEQALVRKDSKVRARVLTPEDVPAVVRIAWRYEFFREDVTIDTGPDGYVLEFRFGPGAQGPWMNSGLIPFEDLGIHFNQPLTDAVKDILDKIEERMETIRSAWGSGIKKKVGRR